MKKAAVLLGLTLGWATMAFAAKPIPSGDAARGESQVAVCSACHGADGNGMAPFPKLAGQGEKYLYQQLLHFRDGTRVAASMMGQVDNKTDQELADIAAFYASQAPTGGQTDPELVELGEAIYRGGIADRGVPACAACHAPSGKGNAPAGFPSLAGQHAEYTADQLRAYRKGYEDPTGRVTDGDIKIMRGVAFNLSDLEIEAVSSYVAGLQ